MQSIYHVVHLKMQRGEGRRTHEGRGVGNVSILSRGVAVGSLKPSTDRHAQLNLTMLP